MRHLGALVHVIERISAGGKSVKSRGVVYDVFV